jgi:hypothetical protein
MTKSPAPYPPMASHVATIEQLGELYRSPSALVSAKVRSGIDEGSAAYIASSPFVLVGTTGPDGRNDVSPRGGPAGFVKVLGDHHVAIPDLNGNNLIDSLRAVVATGRAGLLFLVPGRDETLRLNGDAWVTTDGEVIDRWDGELRRPKSAIVVAADEVFIHCAKAFRRSSLWDPSTWDHTGAPDGSDILVAQGHLGEVDAATIRAALEQGYEHDLALDVPERP